MPQTSDRVTEIVKQTLLDQGGIAMADGVSTLASPNLDTPDIDGGTIEDVLVTGSLEDATTVLVDNVDPTKKLAFQLSGLTTETTRTLTPPDADDTIMGLGTVQTVTAAKTFGAPGAVGKLKVAGTTSGAATIDAPAIAGSAVITLPSATDTLLGRASTDTVTGAKTFADGMLKVAGATSGTAIVRAPAIAGATDLTLPSGTQTLASLEDVDISAAPGSAGSRTTILVRREVVDNVAEDFITVTVPNNVHGGQLRVTAMGQLGDGDSTHSVEHLVSFSRITGANAKAVASSAVGSAKTTGAGADATTTIAVSAVGGAVGATNTFTITGKVARSAGASDGHTLVLYAELLNGQTGGLTMDFSPA